jgi:hypothetical protein
MGHVWNWRDARAFNTAGHPSLGPGSPPVLINGSHAHTAPSPALVAVYPSSSESPAEPYPIVYVPPSSTVSVPPGFYVIARPGDEFIVRVGGRGGVDAICNAANSNLVLVNLRVDGKELSVRTDNLASISPAVFGWSPLIPYFTLSDSIARLR